jgi:hypothetical protein
LPLRFLEKTYGALEVVTGLVTDLPIATAILWVICSIVHIETGRELWCYPCSLLPAELSLAELMARDYLPSGKAKEA